jgi:type IV fimbrial biogenesis protein FimT
MEAMTRSNSLAVQFGFTLVELMVSVALVGILLTLAVPSFRELILNQYVRGGASDLQTALYFARSEAIKRAAQIDVVPTGTNWRSGWTVQVNGAGTVLRSQTALSDQLASMAGASTISFFPNGRSNGAVTVKFFTSNNKITARCVVVDLSGRPGVVYDTDGDPSNAGCS